MAGESEVLMRALTYQALATDLMCLLAEIAPNIPPDDAEKVRALLLKSRDKRKRLEEQQPSGS